MNSTGTTNEQSYPAQAAPVPNSRSGDLANQVAASGHISIMNETGGGTLGSEQSPARELTLSEHRKEFIYESFVERPVAVPMLTQPTHKRIVAVGKDQPMILRRANNHNAH